MATISCPKCNTPIDSRSTFCGNCGYALQATGAATSYPPRNMPSSPAYPIGGTPPPYPPNNISSSFTYPAGGSPPPPPPYPSGNMPSSPIYPVGGTPPPYPPGNMPSSPTYPTGGSQVPPGTYPKSEPNLPPQPPQQPQQPQPRRRGKRGIAILAIIVVIVLLGTVLASVYAYMSHNTSLSKTNATPTQGTTATTAPTSNATTPTQSTTATATAAATLTSGATTPTQSTTATTVSGSNSYSATQPGPGCDSNGGTWTPQGISKITCGTQVSVSSGNARGYLSLQLPSNQAFSPNNSIGITGTLSGSNDCVGLAEQGANSGYLAEYCNDGNWHIYSISSAGAVVKTLAESITSTRTNEQLSLTLNGTTLSFSIDSEVHKINITSLQPTKVAVTYVTPYYYGGTVTITNFSYTTQ